ncbi:unnamed protein product [Paramecium sonneborni]|uniref:Uncharacterized protein n=1 Tax=Paramecium sonneborni TaxID=65129 RepID=A0A8S1JYN6_9CILI|nr:unnamed protein product [Paramecium sonneborni]
MIDKLIQIYVKHLFQKGMLIDKYQIIELRQHQLLSIPLLYKKQIFTRFYGILNLNKDKLEFIPKILVVNKIDKIVIEYNIQFNKRKG